MMADIKSYGVNKSTENMSALDVHKEEIELMGFTVLKGVFSPEQVDQFRMRLDAVYQQQEDATGKEALAEINELNMARCPFLYDETFMQIFTHERLLELVRSILGNYFILHLQNGIINKPNKEHHQSSWHRDLPYQDYVISAPIALSAFTCVDPFNSETGATWLLPFSHQIGHLPSVPYLEKHKVQLQADPGDVLIFNSMVYHCAGYNSSNIIRRGINNIFTVPLLKQQLDLPRALKGKYEDDPFLAQLMGYTSHVRLDDQDYRQGRIEKQRMLNQAK